MLIARVFCRLCAVILALHVAPAIAQQPSPELMRVLQEWEAASKQIKSLSGDHHRIVYDLVFDVEKHADGKFYYESPDKGRIDIESTKIPDGQKGQRINPKTGAQFEVKSEQPQKWICDGARIIQLNEDARTAEIFQIPPDGRGENIMNGPLPFLFGMPAEVALQRYELEIVEGKNTNSYVMLQVKPRLQRDAANWKQAKVILSKPQYLPSAVQLVDPTGNAETVYTFAKLVVNKREIPFIAGFWRKWYEPKLSGYNITTQTQPAVAQDSTPQPRAEVPEGHTRVPSLIGLHYKNAQELLGKMELKVKYLRGTTATNEKVQYHVYQQQPIPGQVIKIGETVELTLYDKVSDSAAANNKTAPR